MKKVFISFIVGSVILGYGLLIYFAIQESNHRLLIQVRTPGGLRIGHTMIRLESENDGTIIQNMTTSLGNTIFKKLAPGTYRIRATQISCNGSPAHEILVIMKGRGQSILYHPCP